MTYVTIKMAESNAGAPIPNLPKGGVQIIKMEIQEVGWVKLGRFISSISYTNVSVTLGSS